MKSNKGFTLIELIIGMAIMAIVFGGIVYLFGASSMAARYGMDQQQAYEDARQTMDVLKTTLRYADTTQTDTPAYDSTSWTYTGVINRHPNETADSTADSNGLYNVYYQITVSLGNGQNPDGTAWKDTSKKQLLIHYDTYNKGSLTGGTALTKPADKRFPKYEENSALIAAGNSVTEGSNKYESGFPIITESKTYNGNSITTYKILLPVAYKIKGATKIDTMVTRVKGMNLDYNTTSDSGGGGGGSSTDDPALTRMNSNAEHIAKTMSTILNKDSGKLRGKGGYAWQIASGAFYQTSSTAGITRKVYTDKAAEGKPLQDFIGDVAWILISKDANGDLWTVSNKTTAPAGWRLFLAKNVINDKITQNSPTSSTSASELEADAEQKGVYVIRPNFGFITYIYDFNSNGEFETYGVKGYASCIDTPVKDGNKTMHYYNINQNSWVLASDNAGKGYLKLRDSSSENKYIEDVGGTGTHNRIDYDGSGAEYTKATCEAAGTTYNYWPNGATQNN